MLEDEEYPSDSEQSDEDFKPNNEDSDLPSEEDSDGLDDDAEYQTAAVKTAKKTERKRKSRGRPAGSKRKTRRTEQEVEKELSEEEEEEETKDAGKEEDDKARADALWADFLSGTDSGPVKEKAAPQKTVASNAKTVVKDSPAKKTSLNDSGSSNNSERKTVKEIFDFAGETIEVEKPIAPDSTVSSSNDRVSAKNSPVLAGISRIRTAGGLSAVLGQIDKKQKINTLEKTQMDWKNFKQQQGIQEELQTHNKGREGFLERQDFLERTDHRQFEREKNMRQATRRK